MKKLTCLLSLIIGVLRKTCRGRGEMGLNKWSQGKLLKYLNM